MLSSINVLRSIPSNETDLEAVADADAIYESGVLNAGYDNSLVNDDDQNTIQAQVERLDVIWYSDLFPYYCRSSNHRKRRK
ncbi:MAG: hypothetical protein ACI905_000871 [Roseivirga sp.]